jgi:hypothetical protein
MLITERLELQAFVSSLRLAVEVIRKLIRNILFWNMP